MSDYTDSKSGIGAVFIDGAIDDQWQRVEPLIKPEQLRIRHLFGIPLVSNIIDPITKRAAVMTDDILKDYIDRAVSVCEMESGIDIFPTRLREKHAFDRAEFNSFGYLKVNRRPVQSLDKLTITPANNVDIYEVPLEWVEVAYLRKGQIYIIPQAISISNSGTSIVPSQSSGGSIYMSIFGTCPWIPAFWQVEYTTGFADGNIPKVVNELIGCIASMEILSMLASTYAQTSGTSLGIDGLSQSVSTPGPQIFSVRLQELADKRKMLSKKLKTLYGLTMFSSNV